MFWVKMFIDKMNDVCLGKFDFMYNVEEVLRVMVLEG